ncbi:seminal metalloprotease 1-like [Achroia grisella]|uniref:seminal metalloprotease 1-like n=1 Tax=Achroia grisella TaxID=688607 RepID=UPI0027D29CA3|nr:seminal metalloprotease 1-like [Achroia grisella]
MWTTFFSLIIAFLHRVNAISLNKNVSHWSMGIIPYYIDTEIYDYLIEYRIRAAMNILEEASCVRFKPLVKKPYNSSKWVYITNLEKERECIHEPRLHEKHSGAVLLVLGFDCLRRREVLHSLMHAIGFQDEVSHPQRDQYIRVMWENIHPKYRSLFRIQTNDASSKNFVEYDPMSIMHFHDRAYTSNGQATITPLLSGLVISPSDVLSQLDKIKLRMMFGYECNKRKVGNFFDSCKDALHNQTPNKINSDIKGQEESGGIADSNSEDEMRETENNVTRDNAENQNKTESDEPAVESDSIERASDVDEKQSNDNVSEIRKEDSNNDKFHSNSREVRGDTQN